MQEFYRDAHGAFKHIRPKMLYTHNAFALRDVVWGVGEDYERSVGLDDIVTSIGDWGSSGPLGPTRDVNEIWKSGMLTRYLRGISGKQVWMQVGVYMYNRDYQARPVHELRVAAYAIVANGGSPVYITNAFPDGSVDTVLADRLAKVLPENRGRAAISGVRKGFAVRGSLLFERQRSPLGFDSCWATSL
jgi:hypothetical protein